MHFYDPIFAVTFVMSAVLICKWTLSHCDDDDDDMMLVRHGLISKDCKRKILAFERKSSRKFLRVRVSWTQKMIKNEELYKKNRPASWS